MHRSYVVAL